MMQALTALTKRASPADVDVANPPHFLLRPLKCPLARPTGRKEGRKEGRERMRREIHSGFPFLKWDVIFDRIFSSHSLREFISVGNPECMTGRAADPISSDARPSSFSLQSCTFLSCSPFPTPNRTRLQGSRDETGPKSDTTRRCTSSAAVGHEALKFTLGGGKAIAIESILAKLIV